MSFRYENVDTPKVFRKRTAESFLVSVRHISRKYSYEKIADMLGVNKWHVWQIVNNPCYFPSNALCRRLNLVKSMRTHRFAIYSDIEHLSNTMAIMRKQMDEKTREALKDRL